MTLWIISWRHLGSTQQPPGGTEDAELITYLTVVAGRQVRTVVVSRLRWVVVVVALVTAVLKIEFRFFPLESTSGFILYFIVSAV